MRRRITIHTVVIVELQARDEARASVMSRNLRITGETPPPRCGEPRRRELYRRTRKKWVELSPGYKPERIDHAYAESALTCCGGGKSIMSSVFCSGSGRGRGRGRELLFSLVFRFSKEQLTCSALGGVESLHKPQANVRPSLVPRIGSTRADRSTSCSAFRRPPGCRFGLGGTRCSWLRSS